MLPGRGAPIGWWRWGRRMDSGRRLGWASRLDRLAADLSEEGESRLQVRRTQCVTHQRSSAVLEGEHRREGCQEASTSR